MESRNYHKTELAIVTVNDLDGEIAPESGERNLLREKTFNSELTSLVTQIFNNEKLGDKAVPYTEDGDATQKISLLQRCESLIYRLKHSDELSTVSSSYDPFDTDINLYDDIDDTADYIRSGLMQCNLSRFQLLKYCFRDKAYRSDINLLDQSYTSDMYFSINDPLIKQLDSHTEGFVITPELVSSDPFFTKKFLNDETVNNAPGSFFLIKISSFLPEVNGIPGLEVNISPFEQLLSPLLLVELNPGNPYKPEDIFKMLKKTVSVPLLLYFLKNSIQTSAGSYSYEDTLLMIELFARTAAESDIKSYTITLKDYSSKENIFILKYVLSKARRILDKNSLIVRTGLNNAVIITSSGVEQIFTIIDRANSGIKIIDIQPVDYSSKMNSRDFVNLFL